jgi:hypothetical protein
MDDRRTDDESPDAIEGADAASLGTAPPPESAPPGARVDDAEHQVPGPTFDGPGRVAKPWNTSLAADSDQAGVANDPDTTATPLERAEHTGDDEPV